MPTHTNIQFPYDWLVFRTSWMLAAALLISHARGQTTSLDVPPVISLLTPGTTTVEILKIELPDDIQAIQSRVRAAIVDIPAWYVELFKQTPRGQRLPYDARLGISEAEYERLRTARRTMTVIGCSTMTLKTIAAVPGQVYLSGGPGLEGLNRVSFRPSSGGGYWVNTVIGTAGAQEAFITPTDSVLGVHSGYRWSLGIQRDDKPNNQFAFLAISRDQTGRLILEQILEQWHDGQKIWNVQAVARTANCQP